MRTLPQQIERDAALIEALTPQERAILEAELSAIPNYNGAYGPQAVRESAEPEAPYFYLW